ncbi:MAG: HAMP domain-containing histidine kinase [Clostridia bacterium]|nr:HAMP domain-containing histidine kinase [Clostridia bacterium]
MTKKRKKLSLEILGDLAISFAAAIALFLFLFFASIHIADTYLFLQNIELSDIDYDYMISWIFSLGLIISVAVYVIIFLILLGKRLSDIPKITKGIEALRDGREHRVEVEGTNELCELANSINYLSETQRRVRSEEEALMKEKEELIRSLSHDIRTPLTSIMAYSELIAAQSDISEEDRREYFALIRKKSEQIKELTDILLDGGSRKLEYFEDCRLLMVQLADEFEYSLEDTFKVSANINLPSFPGSFDPGELQRIFDNLISNVRKYADPEGEISLSISLECCALAICQSNRVSAAVGKGDSYGIGLKSIRRIAQLYGGRADVKKDNGRFEIKIILTDFS